MEGNEIDNLDMVAYSGRASGERKVLIERKSHVFSLGWKGVC